MLRHPEPDLLASLTGSLDTGTAGLLLHVLRCEDCASQALAALAQAFHGLIRLGEPFEACCVAIHLCRSLVQRRRPRGELRQVTHQLQPLLASPKVPEEARRLLASLVADTDGTAPIHPDRLRDLADGLERMRAET